MNDLNLHVTRETGRETLRVARGTNLRKALLDNGFSLYRGAFRKINCGGLGVCGSCRVIITSAGQKWNRRACQIQCFEEMEVGLLEKQNEN